jgi:hypothetical protein
MSGQAATRVLIRCDGAAVPSELRDQVWDASEEILSDGRAGGLNLRLDSTGGRVLGNLGPRASDLVRIAAYTYAADQMVRRRVRADAHRAGWRRCFALCIPVADPAFWSTPAVHAALIAALDFATDDAWSFVFSRAEVGVTQLRLDIEDRPLLADPNTVLLFSGGTDSLCALVEAVAGGARPIVVSHRPAPHVDHRQKVLLAALRRQFPGWQFPHLSFWIHRRGSEAVESTQRARAFLFAALGVAVAGRVDLAPVLLPDNGYVSLGPPISAQLVGALTSRGTHPTFLRLMNKFAALVFPGGPPVTNPLADRTRAEALRVLPANNCAELLPETRTCGRLRGPDRTNERPHCGGCSQCVDRRFATIAAGLEAHDPVASYGLDIFQAGLPEGEPRTIAVSYVQYAQRVEALAPEELFLEYPHLEQCLDPDGSGVASSAEHIADLLKRHSGEVLEVLAEMVGRYRSALVRRALPELGLLPLAVGMGVPSAAPIDASNGAELEAAAVQPLIVKEPQRPQHRLERHGRSWLVAFGEEKGLVNHSKGMERLARLLKAPGQRLDALDLVAWFSPGKEADGRDRDGDDEASDPDALSSPGPDRLGARSDPTARRDYRARARQLERELAEDGGPENEAERERIRAELEALSDEMVASTAKGGKARAVPGEQEKARQAVSHTVGKALDQIAPELPGLRIHLDESLHLGRSCSYDPRPRETWDVIY